MGFRYFILGAGRQGTACAFDLACFGEADEIVLADAKLEYARKAVSRLQSLLPSHTRTELRALSVSVENHNALAKTMKGNHVILSAVPYYLNPKVAEAAIAAGVSMCDLGGDTPTTQAERQLDDKAKAARVRIIPDCGLAPGMNNLLAVYGMGQLDHTASVRIWCGGLPQQPVPPLGYRLVFNLEGMLNNYFGKAYVLRNSRVTEIESFTEPEEIHFAAPLGKCEAFVTAGATSTCPWTFEGKLNSYDYKTVRYPGHYDKIRFLRELGLLDTEPVEVKGEKIIPRDLTARVVGDRIAHRETPDLVILRVRCRGTKGNQAAEVVLELMDFYDEKTGFLAMERTTGFATAIIMGMVARNEIKEYGTLTLETDIPVEKFIEEFQRRGITIHKNVQLL